MKARELANVRRLAHEVLLQRSDVETFLVSSIRQVRPTCMLPLMLRHMTSDLCREEQPLLHRWSGEVQQVEGTFHVDSRWQVGPPQMLTTTTPLMSRLNAVDKLLVSSLCHKTWHIGWLPNLCPVSAGPEAQLHGKASAEWLCSPADSWVSFRGSLQLQPCNETARRSSTLTGTAAGTAADSAGAACPQHHPVTMLQVRDQIMRERAEGRGEATPQPLPRPGQQVDIKVSRL